MNRLVYGLLFITTLAAVFLGVGFARHKWHYLNADLQIPPSPHSLITEISLNVYYDDCAGPQCPDYKIIFYRDGREPYYSSVTRIATRTGEVKVGNISNYEFEQLSEVLETQGFFELQREYPENGACADCVFTTVSAVRDGKRKKVTHMYDEMPLQLWIIQKVLAGTGPDVQWIEK